MALFVGGWKVLSNRRPGVERRPAASGSLGALHFLLFVMLARLCGSALGQELLTLPVGGTQVAFSPDGKIVATGSHADAIRLWDVASGKERVHIDIESNAAVQGLAFSRDGKVLAAACDWRKVRMWDPATAKELEPVHSADRDWYTSGLAFSPDDKSVASGTSPSEITLWDLATRKEKLTIRGPRTGMNCVVFSPDGKVLASGNGGGWVKLWDAATGKEVQSFRASTGTAVLSLAYAPDGKAVAAMCVHGPPQVWDLETGQERFTVASGNGGCVAFSPDGKLLAFGTGRGVLTILNASTGEQLVQFQAHKRGFLALAFSPDGKLLATPGSDCTTKIWDVAKLLGQKDK